MTAPRLPVPGEFVRGIGTLVTVEPVKPEPPPPSKDYIFREITARGEIRRNGKTLQSFSTNTDFYGLGRSVIGCVEDMRKVCQDEEISSGSECEVVAVRMIEYFRAQPIGDPHRENFYASDFKPFERLPSGSGWNVPESVEEVVWTSRDPEREVPPLPEILVSKNTEDVVVHTAAEIAAQILRMASAAREAVGRRELESADAMLGQIMLNARLLRETRA